MTTWVVTVQSGTVAAQFELNEPLGGPVWTAVSYVYDDFINILALQTIGKFSLESSGWESVAEYTDAEFLQGIQTQGRLLDYVDGADLAGQSVTWTQTVQSGTPAAMFELNEPLGGPVWTATTKDS